MEDSDKPEKCVPLAKHLKLANFFDLQLPLMQEGLANASLESKITQKSSQNVRTYFLKSVEVVENDCSPGTSRSVRRRSSLMKLFDPLHSMQQTVKIDVVCHDVFTKDREKEFLVASCDEVSSKEILDKYASNNHMNKTLILLESPRKFSGPLISKNLFSGSTKPVKKYSEEEYCRSLKVQKFRLVKEFSQKYSECEKTVAEKDRLLNNEFSKVVTLNRSYSTVLSESLAILESMGTNNEKIAAKLEDLYMKREKLTADIKITKDDFCNTENVFSDIYRRYEMSKGMIKGFKENEERLRKNIESIQASLDEQNSMNKMLESRTQEIMGRTTAEIEAAKKSSDNQIMLLEAELKKSEIKLGSLKMDLKQAKSTNDELGNTYDDLIAKFKP